MDISYAVAPFIAWAIAGSLKFIINSVRAGKPAFGLIGYGGLPSNHSAIVSSAAALIAIREGLDHPAFAVAIALVFIVILDANSLRRQVGKHAVAINQFTEKDNRNSPLRERIGHTKIEIIAGIITGIGTAYFVDSLHLTV